MISDHGPSSFETTGTLSDAAAIDVETSTHTSKDGIIRVTFKVWGLANFAALCSQLKLNAPYHLRPSVAGIFVEV